MRSTRTNSGADSRGVVRFGRWELEGEAYLYVVVGVLGSVLAFVMAFQLALGWRFLVAALPLAAAVAWVKSFLVNRPPHYTGDFFEGLLAGRHFRIEPSDWRARRHPRSPLRSGGGGEADHG